MLNDCKNNVERKGSERMKHFILVAALMCVGCGEYQPGTAAVEQEKTEQNQARLLKTQPPVTLDWSLERENINKRTTLWNDPAKVSYIYLINYGKIMAFYPVKGKVSSVNSQITNPEQLTYRRMNNGGAIHYVEGVLQSPAEDGSYGTNGDAVFFFTTDGTYVEWRGDYMLCDKPLKLTTPPELVRQVEE